MKPAKNFLKKFIALEASAGLVLLAAAFASLLAANSPLAVVHEWLEPAHHSINDGLMVLFFLLVGTEIKRERLEGHLKSRNQYLLPVIAAAGGVILPAAIFWIFNRQDAVAIHGWAIPTATDIAFALCVMQLLGKRVPHALKVTLVTIAIVDDIIAVAIIALFYAKGLDIQMLGGVVLVTALLILMNRYKVSALSAYLLIGVGLWWLVLHSGIHATIAGVILAFCIPLESGRKLEHALHPWVAYGIMPLFAFANAGISLTGISWEMLQAPVMLGISAGLLLGKPIGVLLVTALAVMVGICKIPHEVRWGQYAGMAILCGIGFTMSLFIGGLSYHDDTHEYAVRLGVMLGSVLSAVLGYGILRVLGRR